MKDMTGKDDQFRGPAIRALCSITDVSIPHLIYSVHLRFIIDLNYYIVWNFRDGFISQ